MCGIMGYIGKLSKKDAYEFINTGLKSLQTRGRDATGIYSSSYKALIKAPMDATDFLKQSGTKRFIKKVISEPGVVLAHTRASTHGEPEDNENNHPLYSDDVVLIHNGVVDGDKIDGYKYKGETDTELILAGIQSSKEKREEDRVADGIKNVSGSLAIAVYFRKTGHVYLYRHTNPMYVGKKGSTILFASTESILEDGIKSFRGGSLFRGVEKIELPDDHIFKVNRGDLNKLKFVKAKIKVYSGSKSYGWSKDYGYGSYPNYKPSRYQDGWGDIEVANPKGLMEYPAKLKRVAEKLLKGDDGVKVRLKLHRNDYVFTKDQPICNWQAKHGYFNIEVEVDNLVFKRVNNFYPSLDYSVTRFYAELYDILYGGDPFNRNDFIFMVTD